MRILDRFGKPMPPARARRTMALAPGGNAPYDAGDIYGPTMADWRPYLWSPDSEQNIYRDRIVSRVRDLVRNDGWASGAVTRLLDNIIGANFRPLSKPDYRALAQATGIKGFDADWADEFAKAIEANWRSWALDPMRYCDAMRNMTMPQMMGVAFRHKITDGDSLAQVMWIERGSRYATALQLLDPDRLSNPQMVFDSKHSRGGVVVDDYGAATGYYIRRAHQGDWWSAGDAVRWDLIPRETDWGRPIIVHDFDHSRAGQHRGGAGIFAPVVNRLKMLIKYDNVELESAIINSIFGAFIESPNDPNMLMEALGDEDNLNYYQTQRADFHNERRLVLGGARIPTLFPGEKIGAVASERPSSNFDVFEKSMLRNVAAGTGLSAHQITQDWKDVNYSSARSALLEAWKTFNRMRDDYGIGFCQPVYLAWLEESFEIDNLPLPANAPPFEDFRASYGRAKWMGPGKGWVDPVAEKKGAILGIAAGLSTLEQEAAEQGQDWEETLDQRKRELDAFKKRGLAEPSWAGVEDQDNITEQIRETI